MEPTWQSADGRFKLYHGDCMELLPTLEDKSVDAVICDPPYDQKTHDGAITSSDAGDIGIADFPPHVPISEMVPQWLRICRRWILAFCTMEDIGEYMNSAKTIDPKSWIRAGFWDRICNTPQFSGDRPATAGDSIAIMHRQGRKSWNGGGRAAIWRYMVERGHKQHPTQKPVALMRQLILDFTNEDDLVCDPFCGVGSTGVACKNLGRKFIGIEIEKKYFDVAAQRIKAAAYTPTLF